MTNETIFVVSNTRYQFEQFLRKQKYCCNYIYVGGPEAIRGLRNIKVLFLHPYADRQDFKDIMLQLTISGFKSVEDIYA